MEKGIAGMSVGSPSNTGKRRLSALAELPPADKLKERFATSQTPLSGDFSSLIDIAACGAKAVGGYANGSKPGMGMTLDEDGLLNIAVGDGLRITEGKVEIASSIYSAKIFQKGMIFMFSGSVIPEGWALCDGSEVDIPDLCDQFILAAEDGAQTGTNGEKAIGQDKDRRTFPVTLEDAKPTGRFEVRGHKLTEDEVPEDGVPTGSYGGLRSITHSYLGEEWEQIVESFKNWKPGDQENEKWQENWIEAVSAFASWLENFTGYDKYLDAFAEFDRVEKEVIGADTAAWLVIPPIWLQLWRHFPLLGPLPWEKFPKFYEEFGGPFKVAPQDVADNWLRFTLWFGENRELVDVYKDPEKLLDYLKSSDSPFDMEKFSLAKTGNENGLNAYGEHTHQASLTSDAHSHAATAEMPYYILAYIIKR